MPKMNNFAQQQTGQQPFTDNQNTANQNQFTEQATPNQAPQQKGFFSLPPSLMQIVPWIPFALEAMTGQKVPQIGGTIGEIQTSLQQIQLNLVQVMNSQQQIWTKLEGLERIASDKFTSISQQLANTNNSFRLLATETKKSLEFNPRPKLNEPETDYQEPEYV